MILAVCPNPAVDTLAWVQNFAPTMRIEKELRFPGGKGVHVAMASAELGEKVCLLGFWGGPTGRWIREQCLGLGIDCHGPEIEGWNRICYTFKSASAFDDSELLGSGPSVSTSMVEAFRETFRALLPNAKAAVLSGSLPPQAPIDLYAQLIKDAAEKKVLSFLDCTGEALKHGLQAAPFGVHLNRNEITGLTGETNIQKAAQKFFASIECLALTAGKEGLFLRLHGELLHANVEVAKVISAVGSGDCLLAGLAVAKVRGAGALEMAKLATACGAANCQREELGMIYCDDVDELKKRVKVNKL